MIFKISESQHLSISCINGDHIYNVQGKTVFRRNIYDFDNPLLFITDLKEEPTGVYSLGSLLLISFVDSISIYADAEFKRKETLSNRINIVKKHKNSLIVLTDNSKIYILRETALVPIFLDFINLQAVQDLCVDDQYTFLLTGDGLVFKSYSILYKEALILRKPMKIIPEPIGTPHSIFKKEERVYLCYPDGVEVYNVHENILNLIYRYNTKHYKIVEDDKVFCVDRTVNVLGEYPKVVLNCLVEEMIGRVCVSKEYLYVLEEEEERYVDTQHTYKGHTGVESKLLSLFQGLRSEFTIPGGETQEERVLKDFDYKVLDNFRKFYLELATVNDSIIKKKQILDKLERKILEKNRVLEERRTRLLRRMKEAVEKYNEKLKKAKIDGKQIFNYVETLKNKLREKNTKSNYKEELKAQRNLLTEKLCKN